MQFLAKFDFVSFVLFVVCSYVFCEPDRDRRFIILGDSNIGFALSVGGSIGTGVITSSKFKGKSFMTKHYNKPKRRKYRYEYDDYGPGMWLPWWPPPPYF